MADGKEAKAKYQLQIIHAPEGGFLASALETSAQEARNIAAEIADMPEYPNSFLTRFFSRPPISIFIALFTGYLILTGLSIPPLYFFADMSLERSVWAGLMIALTTEFVLVTLGPAIDGCISSLNRYVRNHFTSLDQLQPPERFRDDILRLNGVLMPLLNTVAVRNSGVDHNLDHLPRNLIAEVISLRGNLGNASISQIRDVAARLDRHYGEQLQQLRQAPAPVGDRDFKLPGPLSAPALAPVPVPVPYRPVRGELPPQASDSKVESQTLRSKSQSPGYASLDDDVKEGQPLQIKIDRGK